MNSKHKSKAINLLKVPQRSPDKIRAFWISCFGRNDWILRKTKLIFHQIYMDY